MSSFHTRSKIISIMIWSTFFYFQVQGKSFVSYFWTKKVDFGESESYLFYKIYCIEQRFPTFWVLSPGILFYEQFWSHVASKLSEIYHFGNFSGPTWTFFKSRYRDRSRWLGTSGLDHSATTAGSNFNLFEAKIKMAPTYFLWLVLKNVKMLK